jgi:acetyltransferase
MFNDSNLESIDSHSFISNYNKTWVMKNGVEVFIRPIFPEDENLMAKFHASLSDTSVYLRYFHNIPLNYRISHERLSKICTTDPKQEMVLVVIDKNTENKEEKIVGVGRLVKLPTVNVGEFAIVISDDHQKLGLGTKLLGELVEIGKLADLDQITGDILPENQGMQKASRKIGFSLKYSIEDHVVKALINLSSSKST